MVNMTRVISLKHLLLLIITLMLPSLAMSGSRTNPESASAWQVKPLVHGAHAMVVTNNKWATMAAQQMLDKGGNAVDAAIAAGFVLGLTEPQSSGVGGGGYALLFTAADHQTTAYDGRETAPHSVNDNWFKDQNGKTMPLKQAILTAKSIGVPSETALFQRLHQHAKLPWRELLQPAIDLADTGFPMSPRLFKLLNEDRQLFANNAKVQSVYFQDGKIKPIGSIIKNPAYAATLRLLAKQPEDFYRGSLASEIIKDINQFAGHDIFNEKDFADYRVKVYPPICLDYRGYYEVCTVPPSSSGGVAVLELLGIYANQYVGLNAENPAWIYQFMEASKLTFADRNQYLADPAFVKLPLPGLLQQQYLAQRAQLIKDRAAATPVTAGLPKGVDEKFAPDNAAKLPGTTSIAIVDKQGNAISMTVTIESQFGSHLFTHGFFLNNELTDFSLEARNQQGHYIANRIEPGKRPRSSIAPVIVFNQQHQVYAVTGSPGGSEIICYVAKNLILMLDMGMTPDHAVSFVNICAANQQPVMENRLQSKTFLPALNKRGENIRLKDMVSGITNILRISDNSWYGAADPRREGVAAGM